MPVGLMHVKHMDCTGQAQRWLGQYFLMQGKLMYITFSRRRNTHVDVLRSESLRKPRKENLELLFNGDTFLIRLGMWFRMTVIPPIGVGVLIGHSNGNIVVAESKILTDEELRWISSRELFSIWTTPKDK